MIIFLNLILHNLIQLCHQLSMFKIIHFILNFNRKLNRIHHFIFKMKFYFLHIFLNKNYFQHNSKNNFINYFLINFTIFHIKIIK